MSTGHSSTRAVALLWLILLLAPSVVNAADEHDYISSEDVAITLGTVGASNGLSMLLSRPDTTGALIEGPLPGEAAVVRWIGGEYHPNKRNFLDDRPGSVYTPLACGALLLSADLAWPGSDRSKQTGQDLYLFTTGLLTTKGVTGIFKGLLRRPRPLVVLEPEKAALREEAGSRDDYRAFFSGHTSSAFFSAAFLNLRLRSIMRRELTPDEYRSWRWGPPALLFSWSSLVGLSRIHAYKHYPSDVLAGAMAGWLMAELFYRIGSHEKTAPTTAGQGGYYFNFRIRF